MDSEQVVIMYGQKGKRKGHFDDDDEEISIDYQSAFHALRPEDPRRALRFFSACGVQTNEKTFGVRNLFGSWRAKLHAAQA